MSRLPKRKSRKIVVGGVTFRWVLKFLPCRRDAREVLLIVQEEAERPGDIMVGHFTTPTVGFGEDLPKAPFAPRDVAEAIRYALTCGWRPTLHTGRVFRLAGVLQLSAFALYTPVDPPKTLDFYERLLGASLL